MLSLILIKLNEEKAIYEFHPNASAEYGIIELARKSNVAIVKEPLQGSECIPPIYLKRVLYATHYLAMVL